MRLWRDVDERSQRFQARRRIRARCVNPPRVLAEQASPSEASASGCDDFMRRVQSSSWIGAVLLISSHLAATASFLPSTNRALFIPLLARRSLGDDSGRQMPSRATEARQTEEFRFCGYIT